MSGDRTLDREATPDQPDDVPEQTVNPKMIWVSRDLNLLIDRICSGRWW